VSSLSNHEGFFSQPEPGGEITDQDRDNLTEKSKTPAEVRSFALLREAQKELKVR
jgi:hypothetical protein